MKLFKSRWWAGSGEESMADAYELHQMLERALQTISMMQQPPRPGTDDDADAWEKQCVDDEATIEAIAKSIYTALTGRIVVKDRKAE